MIACLLEALITCPHFKTITSKEILFDLSCYYFSFFTAALSESNIAYLVSVPF